MTLYSCLFGKHIFACRFCCMLHLLFTWNLSNYLNWKSAGTPFTVKKIISACESRSNCFLEDCIMLRRVSFYNQLSVINKSTMCSILELFRQIILRLIPVLAVYSSQSLLLNACLWSVGTVCSPNSWLRFTNVCYHLVISFIYYIYIYYILYFSFFCSFCIL